MLHCPPAIPAPLYDPPRLQVANDYEFVLDQMAVGQNRDTLFDHAWTSLGGPSLEPGYPEPLQADFRGLGRIGPRGTQEHGSKALYS